MEDPPFGVPDEVQAIVEAAVSEVIATVAREEEIRHAAESSGVQNGGDALVAENNGEGDSRAPSARGVSEEESLQDAAMLMIGLHRRLNIPLIPLPANDPLGICEAEVNSLDSDEDIEVEYEQEERRAMGSSDGVGHINLPARNENSSIEQLAAIYLYSSDEDRVSDPDDDSVVDDDEEEVDIDLFQNSVMEVSSSSNPIDQLDASFVAHSSNYNSFPTSPELKLLIDPVDVIHPSPVLRHCAVCKSSACYLCSRCWQVAYCSEDHQLTHFDEHKVDCENYTLLRLSDKIVRRGPAVISKIQSSQVEGEIQNEYILTAGLDVKKDDLLLEEKPFLISPWCRTQLRNAEIEGSRHLFMRCMTCFGCCKYLGFAYTTCNSCSLPLCSTKCPQRKTHEENECSIIVSMLSAEWGAVKRDTFNLNNYRTPNGDKQIRLLYMDVMIVRLMLKFSQIQLKEGQEQFEILYSKLCATWKTDLTQFLDNSSTARKLCSDIDAALPISCFAAKGKLDVVLNYYSIIENNSYRFDLPFRRFNALCTALNHSKHSCKPNSIAFLKEPHSNDCTEPELEELTIELHSGNEVQRGAAITISYVPIFLGTTERKSYMKEWYGFSCKCKRCLDPQEDGSYTSSATCPICLGGRLSPPNQTSVSVNKKPSTTFSSSDKVEDPNKIIWTCNQIRKGRCKSENNRSITTKRVLDLVEELEEGSCLRLGNLTETADFISAITGTRVPGAIRETAVKRNNGLTLHRAHFVVMKMLDDILRGALFPLPDFTLESLEQFDKRNLNVISESYKVYTSVMAKLQPGFNFNGFPKLILDMATNEYGIRANPLLEEMTVQPPNLARGSQRRTVRINNVGDVIWPGPQASQRVGTITVSQQRQRLDSLQALLASRAVPANLVQPSAVAGGGGVAHLDIFNNARSRPGPSLQVERIAPTSARFHDLS